MRDGEKEVPQGLRKALAVSNRLQVLTVANLKVGMTGNEILTATLTVMRSEGITGTVYSHAIGQHGHGAGPLIGLWDRQKGVSVRGDTPVLPIMWYSIELQATTQVPEWDNQPVRIAQEEDVEITKEGQVKWILGRQTQFHIVR